MPWALEWVCVPGYADHGASQLSPLPTRISFRWAVIFTRCSFGFQSPQLYCYHLLSHLGGLMLFVKIPVPFHCGISREQRQILFLTAYVNWKLVTYFSFTNKYFRWCTLPRQALELILANLVTKCHPWACGREHYYLLSIQLYTRQRDKLFNHFHILICLFNNYLYNRLYAF